MRSWRLRLRPAPPPPLPLQSPPCPPTVVLDSEERRAAAAGARSASDMWGALGTDAWVVVPIHSTTRPGEPASKRSACQVLPARLLACSAAQLRPGRAKASAASAASGRGVLTHPSLLTPEPLPPPLPLVCAGHHLEGTRLTIVNMAKGPAAMAEPDGGCACWSGVWAPALTSLAC